MLITLAILGIFAFIAVFGIKYTKDTNQFFNNDFTTVLKGLCCIIVIFVHIPYEHGNAIQDATGSFGYICVTLFFMISAYGLTWSLNHKDGYLNNFFRKRISALLTPFAIVCILKTICGINAFYGGTNFVFVLFLFYVVFYLSHKYVGKKYQDILICTFVILYSLIGQIANDAFGLDSIVFKWQTESLGFMYGIIFFNIIEQFKQKMEKRYLLKIGILTLLTSIFGISYLKYKYILFAGDYILRIILGISIITLLLTVTIHFKIGNVFTKYLGKISYEVFLVHGFIITMSRFINFRVSSGIYILLVIIATIALSAVLNKVDVFIIKKITGPSRYLNEIMASEAKQSKM